MRDMKLTLSPVRKDIINVKTDIKKKEINFLLLIETERAIKTQKTLRFALDKYDPGIASP